MGSAIPLHAMGSSGAVVGDLDARLPVRTGGDC